MAEKSSQVAEFLRLYIRLRPNVKNILIIAAAVTVLATFVWFVSYRPSFTSEAIALVRPQQATEAPRTPEAAAKVEGLFPKPLGVADYVVLMKSDAILMAVAKAYNERVAKDDPEAAVSVARLRAQLVATSRLEIKTPYTVSYYPTVEMRASAYTPEGAAELMAIWIQEIKAKAHEITFATKEDVYEYLDNEYTSEREAVFSLQQELNEAMREGSELLQALHKERAAIEEKYEVETVELLNAAADEWDDRIAAREAELNLPLISEQVYAATSHLNTLTATLAEKELRLATARARLEAIANELPLYRDRSVPGADADMHWKLELDEPSTAAGAQPDLTEVEVPSTGVNPVAVLLARDASRAKVDLEALPKELQHLNDSIARVTENIDALQARFVTGDTEIVRLMREKEDALETIRVERGYGLEEVQRESERLIANLTRDRQAIEDRLRRDLETKIGVFSSLAQSRLEARLAVANTMDEFQIVTGPSQPEGRISPRVVGFFVVMFVLTTMLVTGAYVVVFVLTDTLRNLGVTSD